MSLIEVAVAAGATQVVEIPRDVHDGVTYRPLPSANADVVDNSLTRRWPGMGESGRNGTGEVQQGASPDRHWQSEHVVLGA